MARFAVIRDGVVANVVEAKNEQDCSHLAPVVPAPDQVARGWAYDGTDFSERRIIDRAALSDHAALRRWEKEVGGFIWNEWLAHSDDRSQGKYTAEVTAISQGVRRDGEYWKFADQIPRSLTNLEMIDLATAARAHVKGCFATEFIVLSQIADGTITITEQIDRAFEN